MATLKSMFKLYDGYSRPADVIEKKTKSATDKILKASGATDNFNKKLDATGASAGKASSGLGKFISMAVILASAVKGIGIADEFTNTAARLNLINDGMHTQLELQDKIFAAANRSRGVYSDMANAVSKLQMLAGDAFSSNDETIAFTELMQKSFKVGGASATEQSSAMLQLTQAMASGRLQGDEYRSISENAPLILEAIARYTGKSRGELKDLASDGEITADIIKNAMFGMSNDINAKFKTMPYTFADIWNKIKNGATKAFRPLIEKVSSIINSDEFKGFTDNLVIGFHAVAKIAGKALDSIGNIYNFVNKNWSTLGPIIAGVTAAWLAYEFATGIASAAQWALNFAMTANPVGLIIVAVGVLIAIIILLWEKCEGFRKFFTGMWASSMKIIGVFVNAFIDGFNVIMGVQNIYATSIQRLVNMFRIGAVAMIRIGSNMAQGIVSSFGFIVDAMNLAIRQYNSVASLFGKKTIDIEFTSDNVNKGIDRLADRYVGKVNGMAGGIIGAAEKTKVDLIEKWDLEEFNKSVDLLAGKIEDFTMTGWIKDTFAKLKEELIGAEGENPYDPNNPLLVEGTGANGSIDVNMADEDLRYLRDIAERDYIAKVANNNLAPQLVVNFGDVHETADVKKFKGILEEMMREEIAISAEGVYANG